MKRAFICFLSAIFILCAVGICGCNFGNDNPGNNPTDTTNPNNNNNNNNQNNSKYSGILNDVLNSDYYNGLIEQSKNGSLESGFAMDPIPYNFLSKQGYEANKLMNQHTGLGSYCYFKENDKNNLLLEVTVTTNNNGDDVYNSYLLNYKLTDKESEDLIMLYNGNYIQSAFFIQELDKQKTPTLIYSVKINKKSYLDMLDALNNKKALQGLFDKNKIQSFTPVKIVKAEDEEDGYRLKISVISTAESNRFVTNRQMCELDLLLYWNAGVSIKNDVIKINRGAFDVENKTEPTNITYFKTNYDLIKNNNLNK